MGWELRNGKRVYYRKQRDPETGRVRSIYCGGGERGELAAREDAERRALINNAGTARPDSLISSGITAGAVGVAHAGVTDIRNIKKGPVADLRHEKKEPFVFLPVRLRAHLRALSPPPMQQNATECNAGPRGEELRELRGEKNEPSGKPHAVEATPCRPAGPITPDEVLRRAQQNNPHVPAAPLLYALCFEYSTEMRALVMERAGVSREEQEARGLAFPLRV